MKWIDIKVKEPEQDRPILITDGEVIVSARYKKYKIADKDIFCFNEVGFSGCEWEWDFSEHSITHWAELPELPKK